MQQDQRRLAAILAADVVGYSRLMGADEAGTLGASAAARGSDRPRSPHIRAASSGSGDGLLVEFASAVDAVRCAVEVQAGLAERNAGLPEDRRIAFRMGVNLGDVIVGDGTSMATASTSRRGSSSWRSPAALHRPEFRPDQGQARHRYRRSGRAAVKNIARAAAGFPHRSAKPQPGARPAGKAPPLALPDKPSIAVLPFTNMSGDPEQEYFTDGITEDIITELSRFAGSSSSPATRPSPTRAAPRSPRVGRELGVRYVAEGSVRRPASGSG